jgi:uncharacterized membrane protein YcaP (DUF421 family)
MWCRAREVAVFFFDDWQGIWRTALVGVLAYLALVALLRVSGKRTLSKMNATMARQSTIGGRASDADEGDIRMLGCM